MMSDAPRRICPCFRFLAASVALAAAVAAQSSDWTPLRLNPILRSLDSTCKSLARSGRQAEVESLLEILDELGHSKRSIEVLRRSTSSAMKRAKSPVAVPTAARTLKAAALRLGSRLEQLDEARRVRLAQIILRLDSTCAPGHEALGHVSRDGAWVDPRADRGDPTAVAKLVDAVQRDTFALSAEPCRLPLLASVAADAWWTIRGGNVSFHTDLSRADAIKTVTDVLRGAALSHALRTGKPGWPDSMGWSNNAIVTLRRSTYGKVIQAARAQGLIDEKQAASDLHASTAYFGDYYVEQTGLDQMFGSVLLFLSYKWQGYQGKRAQPSLVFGHLNWIALTLKRTTMPVIRNYDPTARENAGAAEVKVEPTIEAMREALSALARAGKDPALESIAQPDFMALTPQRRLKATFVAAYLQEHGRLGEAIERSRFPANNPDAIAPALARGLGEDLSTFDRRWRAWLLADEANARPGLAQLVER